MDIDLVRRAARNLCGRDVVIRIQEPVVSCTGGQAYKTMTGDAIIDINPATRDVIETLTLQCAHIRLQFSQMAPTTDWKQVPGSQQLPLEMREENQARPIELEAECLAAEWVLYAEQNVYNHYQQSVVDRKLHALLKWRAK